MQERTLILFQNLNDLFFTSLCEDTKISILNSPKKKSSKLFTRACIKLDNVECMSLLYTYMAALG